ncbi:hypothetical protein ACFOLF_28330 [Paenibacillus sepulcri]|uniref:50S ribosomal protein L33 n=1 Tax=Paenibacillus sepulcri TaxID=359917 RepID=A0ABS7C4A2_9BACL|nr:hypothetical protein [Paenibacillus sepulcri]
MAVSREQARKLCGKQVYALKKDGSMVSGKLVQIKGNRLIIAQEKGKNVKTKAFLPLVLFDLLAIGTEPFGFGGGFGFGPFGGFGDPFFF